MGNVEKVDRAAYDLFVLPSRRGLNPEDPGFDPEEFLDKLCEEAMSIQREILGRNAEVEYLQRHGLGGRTDVESFRQCVPLVSYGGVEEDIMKLVQGMDQDQDQDQKRPILTVDPITHFNIRSLNNHTCFQCSSEIKRIIDFVN